MGSSLVMETLRLPNTSCSCPGPWPFTSALGLSTRRYSASRSNDSPVSKRMLRMRPCCFDKSSRGQGSAIFEFAGFIGKHDGNAVADGIGKARRLGNELLLFRIVVEASFSDRAHQDFKQLRIHFAGL